MPDRQMAEEELMQRLQTTQEQQQAVLPALNYTFLGLLQFSILKLIELPCS
jgi:hypothetical protein